MSHEIESKEECMITPNAGCLVWLESQRDSAFYNLFQFILTCCVRRSGARVRGLCEVKKLLWGDSYKWDWNKEPDMQDEGKWNRLKVPYRSFKFCIIRFFLLSYLVAFIFIIFEHALFHFCFRVRLSSSSAESDSLIALSLRTSTGRTSNLRIILSFCRERLIYSPERLLRVLKTAGQHL